MNFEMTNTVISTLDLNGRKSMINRLSLNCLKHPNFFGCWMLEDTSVCDDLIECFECNEDSQNPGRIGDGKVISTRKQSTDIVILPRDLEDEKSMLHRHISSIWSTVTLTTKNNGIS